MLRLIPSTLALMAVQRQRAASKSAKPESKAQHLLEGGDPTTMLTSPRRSAQTPSFNVSLGQDDGGGGHAGEGGGGGVGVGLGLHELQALVNVEWRRRENTKKRAQICLEAIAAAACYSYLVTGDIRTSWGAFLEPEAAFLKEICEVAVGSLIEWKRVKKDDNVVVGFLYASGQESCMISFLIVSQYYQSSYGRFTQ